MVEGGAARALLDEAADADLVVTGSRGLSGWVGAALGSVAQSCVRHSPCPLVVVR
ncbi:MAG: universal stress protein [Acidimicrobiales bacterium]